MTTTARAFGLAASTATVLLISACGAPAPSPQSPPATSPASPAPASSVVPIDLEITHGSVHGPGLKVQIPLGSVVRLTIRSDQADELHIHGYDTSVELQASQPATVEFPASIPGVFEVELHHNDEVKLPSLEVR